MKLIFLDESGFAKNWKDTIDEQPFYVLGGIMIDAGKYFSAAEVLREAVTSLGIPNAEYPLGRGHEIKARDIAKGGGWWARNEDKRNAIRDLMLSFPINYGGDGFLMVIDKNKHITKYYSPESPHDLAFQFMFERLQWKLEVDMDEAICIYDQTKILDDSMHEASTELIREGSTVEYRSDYYGHVRKTVNINRIKEFYLGKSDNSIGLQVADYLATFGYQYFKGGCPEDCGWWETLKSGLCRNETVLNGYGLKVFP